jgi:predicted DNA-binding transcriptional regulator YafY
LKLLCDNRKKEAVKAYFGDDVKYKEKVPGFFTVTAGILEEPQFYGWLTAMGKEVRILKPKKAAQAYREYLKAIIKEYK